MAAAVARKRIRGGLGTWALSAPAVYSGLIFPTAGEATVLGHVPWKRENAYRGRDDERALPVR